MATIETFNTQFQPGEEEKWGRVGHLFFGFFLSFIIWQGLDLNQSASHS